MKYTLFSINMKVNLKNNKNWLETETEVEENHTMVSVLHIIHCNEFERTTKKS